MAQDSIVLGRFWDEYNDWRAFRGRPGTPFRVQQDALNSLLNRWLGIAATTSDRKDIRVAIAARLLVASLEEKGSSTVAVKLWRRFIRLGPPVGELVHHTLLFAGWMASRGQLRAVSRRKLLFAQRRLKTARLGKRERSDFQKHITEALMRNRDGVPY